MKIDLLGEIPISSKVRLAIDSGAPIVLQGRGSSDISEIYFKIAESVLKKLKKEEVKK